MPAEIYPGAQWNPGDAAGFTKGRTHVNAVICHYTVGKNSTGIGLDGYFNFLVSRDGHIQQFAECSALTWHAGEANGVGPGIEVEFLDEPEGIFTDAARDACSGLIHWISREWGVPLTYYDGPRIPPADMHEFVAHGSVQQGQAHTDYWPRADWDRMVAGEGDDDVKALIIQKQGEPFMYVFIDGYKYPTKNRKHIDLMYFLGQSSNGADNVAVFSASDFDSIPDLDSLIS
jgi:N-acetylmuramoyl-L-alanine amidase